jgi:hypothetical protein
MLSKFTLGILALALLSACETREPTRPGEEPGVDAPTASNSPAPATAERAAMDRLARRVAKALKDAEFRAALKLELDRSPFGEQKIHFQRFLSQSGGQAVRQLARLSGDAEEVIEEDARAASLEVYFPVPAHRAAWKGGTDVLVASAQNDRDAPIAYDVTGRRHVLSPDAPPTTPVLAVVPVETNFDRPAGNEPFICCAGGPVPPPVLPAGLYMTYARFVQDFEGWLKGGPEFEIHILGQAGSSDSLTDYQCAGEPASGFYRFDQNSLSWSGSVLLFTQTQLSNYKAAHPNQNFRIIALEDDDTGCEIKFDANRFKNLQATINAQYPNLTGSKDTSSSALGKYIKRANALQKILRSVYSFITTQDDMIGNAIEDVVVGQFVAGANWIVKGEGNVTNGWLKLEMR